MTDRDRLIELLFKVTEEKDCPQPCEIADYLIANGVIVPPCKVGDTVYYLAHSMHTKITKVKSGKVVRIAITESGIDLFVDNWTAKLPYGKRSFLTKEEAEQALAERNK